MSQRLLKVALKTKEYKQDFSIFKCNKKNAMQYFYCAKFLLRYKIFID